MDTRKSSVPHAHPFTEDHGQYHAHDHGTDHDHPHACNYGWVTIGQIALDSETGEETEEYALYLCRKCAERS